VTPLLSLLPAGRSAHSSFFDPETGNCPCDRFGGAYSMHSRFAAALAGCEWDGRGNAELHRVSNRNSQKGMWVM
jgi:hypothetical protein